MSFFDRLSDAAKQAKKALDESGVLEEIGSVVEQATAGEAAHQTGEQPTQAQPEGIVDPATLLTLEDVREVSGAPVDVQHPFIDEEWLGMIFSSEGADQRYFELRVAKAPDYETFDADSMWEFLVTEVSPQEPVQGLTDGAFRSAPDTIFFRVGDQVLHTVGNLGDQTSRHCEELARRAVARLG